MRNMESLLRRYTQQAPEERSESQHRGKGIGKNEVEQRVFFTKGMRIEIPHFDGTDVGVFDTIIIKKQQQKLMITQMGNEINIKKLGSLDHEFVV